MTRWNVSKSAAPEKRPLPRGTIEDVIDPATGCLPRFSRHEADLTRGRHPSSTRAASRFRSPSFAWGLDTAVRGRYVNCVWLTWRLARVAKVAHRRPGRSPHPDFHVVESHQTERPSVSPLDKNLAIGVTIAAVVILAASFLPWGDLHAKVEMPLMPFLPPGQPSPLGGLEVTQSITGWNSYLELLRIKLPNALVVFAAIGLATLCWLKARSLWTSPPCAYLRAGRVRPGPLDRLPGCPARVGEVVGGSRAVAVHRRFRRDAGRPGAAPAGRQTREVPGDAGVVPVQCWEDRPARHHVAGALLSRRSSAGRGSAIPRSAGAAGDPRPARCRPTLGHRARPGPRLPWPARRTTHFHVTSGRTRFGSVCTPTSPCCST